MERELGKLLREVGQEIDTLQGAVKHGSITYSGSSVEWLLEVLERCRAALITRMPVRDVDVVVRIGVPKSTVRSALLHAIESYPED